MKKNMSSTDGVIRILLAVAIGALAYFNVISGVLLIILAIAGGIFLITGFVNFCPLYAALGIRTRSKTT